MQKNEKMKSMILKKLRDLTLDNIVLIAVSSSAAEVVKEVALHHNCASDFIITSQIDAPKNKGICIGAVAEDKVFILNEEAVAYLDIDYAYVKAQIVEQAEKIKKLREELGHARLHNLAGKRVILVTDVMKTGINVLAALKYLDFLNVSDILVISGKASKEAVYLIENQGARVVSGETTSDYDAICEQEDYFEGYQITFAYV